MDTDRAKSVAVGCLILLSSMALPGDRAAAAQDVASFQIVWIVVGEVASADSGPPRAGRQLFRGPDLAAFSMQDVKVVQVKVDPDVSELAAGQRICMTQLRVSAFGPDRAHVPAAPLSISIRQDHRHRLNLQRKSDDICFEPQEPGEYPVRVTSLVPAADGTMRGAQFFLRVMADPE
jgi:hypothetical protein